MQLLYSHAQGRTRYLSYYTENLLSVALVSIIVCENTLLFPPTIIKG
jgi:hypothetical protein